MSDSSLGPGQPDVKGNLSGGVIHTSFRATLVSSRLEHVRNLTFRSAAALGAALLAACADGLEPVPFQGVSGTVTYLSEPEGATTDWVRLAVYRELPETELDLLNFVAFSDTLATGESGAAYAIALEPDEYAWLVVVWKERGNESLLTALRAAGWYSMGGGPFEMPIGYTVAADSETAGLDLTADFANMLTIEEVLDILP